MSRITNMEKATLLLVFYKKKKMNKNEFDQNFSKILFLIFFYCYVYIVVHVKEILLITNSKMLVRNVGKYQM